MPQYAYTQYPTHRPSHINKLQNLKFQGLILFGHTVCRHTKEKKRIFQKTTHKIFQYFNLRFEVLKIADN